MSGINRIKRSFLDIPALHFRVHFPPRDTALMHRALCISEILHEILLYASQQCIQGVTSHRVCAWHAFGDELSHCSTSCAYDIEMQRGRPTPRHTFLFAAALSCKTFSGVALDLLWRVLDSPEPLRHLLKYYDILDVEESVLKTCTRYRAYVNRIRGIRCGTDLFAYNCKRHLKQKDGATRTKQSFTLPRLRSARIDVAPSSKYQRPFGLLTSALTSVALNFIGNRCHWSQGRASSYVNSYLHALTNQPSLDTLELDWLPVVPDAASLTRLPKLRTLRVALLANIANTISFLAALHASSIPDVRAFVEQEDCDIPTVDYRRMRIGGPIELSLSGNPSALCLDRLLCIFAMGEANTEIHLTCEFEFPDHHSLAESPISSTAVEALSRTLCCQQSTLAIALRATLDLSSTSSSNASFSFASIQPLLRIRCMTRFEVAANIPFALSDDDIDALARAWPDLEAFEARLYHGSLQGSGVLPKTCPTLRSLISLARYCPKLYEVYIPFRADVDSVPWEEWPSPGDGHRTLRRLTVDGGEVLLGEGKALGMALQQTFPRATVDTRNVFDMGAWDSIVQAKLRFRLYTEMCDCTIEGGR